MTGLFNILGDKKNNNNKSEGFPNYIYIWIYLFFRIVAVLISIVTNTASESITTLIL